MYRRCRDALADAVRGTHASRHMPPAAVTWDDDDDDDDMSPPQGVDASPSSSRDFAHPPAVNAARNLFMNYGRGGSRGGRASAGVRSGWPDRGGGREGGAGGRGGDEEADVEDAPPDDFDALRVFESYVGGGVGMDVVEFRRLLADVGLVVGEEVDEAGGTEAGGHDVAGKRSEREREEAEAATFFVRSQFVMADEDGDGAVSFDDFTAYMQSIAGVDAERDVGRSTGYTTGEQEEGGYTGGYTTGGESEEEDGAGESAEASASGGPPPHLQQSSRGESSRDNEGGEQNTLFRTLLPPTLSPCPLPATPVAATAATAAAVYNGNDNGNDNDNDNDDHDHDHAFNAGVSVYSPPKSKLRQALTINVSAMHPPSPFAKHRRDQKDRRAKQLAQDNRALRERLLRARTLGTRDELVAEGKALSPQTEAMRRERAQQREDSAQHRLERLAAENALQRAALTAMPARTVNEIEPEIAAAKVEMERRLVEDRGMHERHLAEENDRYFALVAAAGLQGRDVKALDDATEDARTAHQERRRCRREDADALLEELNAAYTATVREAEARGSGQSLQLSAEVEAAWEAAELRRMHAHLARASERGRSNREYFSGLARARLAGRDVKSLSAETEEQRRLAEARRMAEQELRAAVMAEDNARLALHMAASVAGKKSIEVTALATAAAAGRREAERREQAIILAEENQDIRRIIAEQRRGGTHGGTHGGIHVSTGPLWSFGQQQQQRRRQTAHRALLGYTRGSETAGSTSGGEGGSLRPWSSLSPPASPASPTSPALLSPAQAQAAEVRRDLESAAKVAQIRYQTSHVQYLGLAQQRKLNNGGGGGDSGNGNGGRGGENDPRASDIRRHITAAEVAAAAAAAAEMRETGLRTHHSAHMAGLREENARLRAIQGADAEVEVEVAGDAPAHEYQYTVGKESEVKETRKEETEKEETEKESMDDSMEEEEEGWGNGNMRNYIVGEHAKEEGEQLGGAGEPTSVGAHDEDRFNRFDANADVADVSNGGGKGEGKGGFLLKVCPLQSGSGGEAPVAANGNGNERQRGREEEIDDREDRETGRGVTRVGEVREGSSADAGNVGDAVCAGDADATAGLGVATAHTEGRRGERLTTWTHRQFQRAHAGAAVDLSATPQNGGSGGGGGGSDDGGVRNGSDDDRLIELSERHMTKDEIALWGASRERDRVDGMRKNRRGAAMERQRQRQHERGDRADPPPPTSTLGAWLAAALFVVIVVIAALVAALAVVISSPPPGPASAARTSGTPLPQNLRPRAPPHKTPKL